MVRPFYSLAARMVLVLFLFNSFSTSAVALTVSSTGLSVEAGADQEITAGDTLALDGEAYVQGLDGSASSLTEATIDWGDGTSDTATQRLDAFAFYLEGSHLYSTADVYTVTVCATDGVSELTCDSFEINVVAATLPDLTVDSVVYNATDHAFDVTVGNEGTADVDSGATPQLSFYISYTSSALEDAYTGSFDLDTLTDGAYRAMGGTSSFSTSSDFTVDDVTYCTAYIMAVIDPADDIEELNEGTFEANYHRETIDLCGEATLPDFVVSDVYAWEFSTETYLAVEDIPAESDPSGYVLYFDINNQGGDATIPDVEVVELNLCDVVCNSVMPLVAHNFGFFGGSPDVLTAGGTSTDNAEEIYTGEPDVSGVSSFEYCVDQRDLVLEEDDTNNCTSFVNPFYIAPTGDDDDDDDTDADPIFTIEAGDDQTLVAGSILSLDGEAYVENLGDETLTNASVTWEGTTSSTPTGVVDAEDSSRTNLIDSYTYNVEGTYTVTVCAGQGESEALCDSFTLTVTAAPVTTTETTTSSSGGGAGTGQNQSSSSGSSSNSDDDEDSDVTLTGSGDTTASEDVVLTEDEVAACGAMSFTDVAADDANYDSIYRMWCEGVVHGYDSLHFGTSDAIKRDEVSKIVSRLFGYVTVAHEELPTLTETSYTDVSTDEPLAYYVETLTEEGFYADEEVAGVFNPHEDMSFGEIVDLLDQVTGQDVSLEGYAAEDSMSRGSFASFVFSYFE